MNLRPHNPVPFDINLLLAELESLQTPEEPPAPEPVEEDSPPEEVQVLPTEAGSFRSEVVLHEIVAEFDDLYARVLTLSSKIESLRAILNADAKPNSEDN